MSDKEEVLETATWYAVWLVEARRRLVESKRNVQYMRELAEGMSWVYPDAVEAQEEATIKAIQDAIEVLGALELELIERLADLRYEEAERGKSGE